MNGEREREEEGEEEITQHIIISFNNEERKDSTLVYNLFSLDTP